MDAVLLVALPEVDLHALHAPLAQHRKFLPAHIAEVHAVARLLGDLVVRAAGVVPEQHPDPLLAAVRQRTRSAPPGSIRFQFASMSEYLPTHLRAEVDEAS